VNTSLPKEIKDLEKKNSSDKKKETKKDKNQTFKENI